MKQTKCSSVEPGFPKLVGTELNLLKTNPATENIHSRLKSYLVLLMDLLYLTRHYLLFGPRLGKYRFATKSFSSY